jgi:hypothetical protein
VGCAPSMSECAVTSVASISTMTCPPSPPPALPPSGRHRDQTRSQAAARADRNAATAPSAVNASAPNAANNRETVGSEATIFRGLSNPPRRQRGISGRGDFCVTLGRADKGRPAGRGALTTQDPETADTPSSNEAQSSTAGSPVANAFDPPGVARVRAPTAQLAIHTVITAPPPSSQIPRKTWICSSLM